MCVKVRYEEMFAHEIKNARQKKPVAYLPLGILEWHGEHNIVGLDGVKALELCIKAAEQGGGLCMPIQFWGENRETHVHDKNYDPKGNIAKAMGLPNNFMNSGHMKGYIIDYKKLIMHMLYQIKSLGFKVVFILCGHYPLVSPAREAAKIFLKENKNMRVYAGMEADPIIDAFPKSQQEDFLPLNGDHHGGKWETSIMKSLRPDLVDMKQISRIPGETITSIIDPECDIFVAVDPRCPDLDKYGNNITKKIITAMNTICDKLLKELNY